MLNRLKASPWKAAQERCVILFVLIVGALATAQNAPAATFRITTRVYEGTEPQPVAEHRILFDEGLIYDLPQKPRRFVTVYDPAQGSITLLDRSTKVQATIGIDGLVKATALARAAAAKKKGDFVGLKAQVKKSNKVAGYSISYGDDQYQTEYQTKTQQPPNPAMATDFGQFSILASQLNIVRRLGSPSFGRMTLAEHISRQGELPSEITLTITRRNQAESFRSTNELEELSETDRTSIREVRAMMDLYRDVDFDQFPK